MTTKQTVRYIEQHDFHLVAWLSEKFGITVQHNSYTREWHAWYGEYDAKANTAFAAALEWAAGHNGLIFDRLADVGERV